MNKPRQLLKSSIVAIGSFDGLHIGHRAILKTLVERAKVCGVPSAVISFDPHPRTVLGQAETKLLTPVDEKIPAMAALGVDELIIIRFDEPFSQLPFEVFAKDYLIGILGSTELVLGEDHGFGRNRSGDIENLTELGAKLGFSLNIVKPVLWNNKSIRSNRIREMVILGDLPHAAHMLGRPYSLVGEVIHGRHRGRKLGFPTVNIRVPDEKLLPPNGVYAAADGFGLPGLVYIGISPTFEGDLFTVEFFGLEEPQAKLGENFMVSLFERFRGEIEFPDAGELIKQMVIDKARLEGWVESHNIVR